MSWWRVAKYALVLFVATAVAAFHVGFVRGFVGATAGAQTVQEAAPVLGLMEILLVAAASVVVFAVLAFRTPQRAFAHAALVALCGWLLSLPVNVLLLGQPANRWAVDGAFLAGYALAGLGLGAAARALGRPRAGAAE